MSNQQPVKQDPSAQAGPSTAAKGPAGDKTAVGEGKKKLPQLGALEDDDEFEEWSADCAELGDALAKAVTAQTGIWEENWDDDDVEDDFTKKIREAIANRMGAPDEQMKD